MRKIILPILLCLFSLSETILYSQVAINSTGASPHSSSIFDISSTTKGLLIPRMTLAELQAIASPSQGLLVYNTSEQAFYNYSGTSWSLLKSAIPARLHDTDGNTSVDAEFSANNDMIYFRLGGNTKMILNENRLEFIDTNHNLFFGENAGQGYWEGSGSYNIAIGESALSMMGPMTDNNVAIGYFALKNTMPGRWGNTAVGYKALMANNSNLNTAFGSDALMNHVSGVGNTAIGAWTLVASTNSMNNTAVGTSSLNVNVGSDNTAVGSSSMLPNTTGFQNVAVGSNSLVNNTTGSYHTAIGFNTGPNASNLANTTTVGIDARATATDMVRIGNVFVNTIGGQVGWTTFSDGRFKENVSEDVPGLSFINQLRPVTYEVNRERFNDFAGLSNSSLASDPAYSARNLSERTTGFIAQEVESSAQSLGFDFSGIDAPDNPDDYYGLRYAEFVVPLVKAVQELSAQNARQQEVIDELIQQNREMKQQLNDLVRD